MSNKEILQNHNTIISDNNITIDELIESIENLPEAGSGEILLQEKSITPTTSSQIVEPDEDYDGLSKVTVNPISEEYIIPTGTMTITKNGIYDVTNYVSVEVDGDTLEVARSIIDKSITSYSDDELTSIGAYMFYNCSKFTELNAPNVESIGEYAFQGSKVKTMYFPKLTNLVANTFRNAKSIVSLDLPNCTQLGNASVYSCTALTSINIPKVETLVRACMTSCTSLEYVDLPICTQIGTQAFNKCTSLKTVILRSETICTLDGTDAFSGCSALESIYVNDALLEDYKVATNWSDYASQIKPLSELEG